MNPATFLGKFICGLCAITGIFILTLPIPIVVTRWVNTYKLGGNTASYNTSLAQFRLLLQEHAVAQ